VVPRTFTFQRMVPKDGSLALGGAAQSKFNRFKPELLDSGE
jgi:hypothetical protein